MRVLKTVSEIRQRVCEIRQEGKTIGLVPTMGYLHEGHISLVKKAKKLYDYVFVSIFVNPIQFGPNEDLDKYPRDFERDSKLLIDNGVDVLFCPEPAVMYPEEFNTNVHVSKLGNRLCGLSRPGHFDGVCTVVLKLFNIIKADGAVFGLKDYQQFTIIKRMVADLNIDIQIVGGEIVRDDDGLALSSRNTYLSEQERISALSLYKALQMVKKEVSLGNFNAAIVKVKIEKFIHSHDFTSVEYVEFLDPENLAEVNDLNFPARCFLAVKVGKTRLIDNMNVH